MKKYKQRLISIIVLVIMLGSIIFPSINVYAHNIPKKQFTINLEEIKRDNPDIYNKLKEIQKKHPNWKFQLFNTGWDWNKFVNFQMERPGRALVEALNLKRKNKSWVDIEYIDRGFDDRKDLKRWMKASRAAIEYTLDPRTYLDSEELIFALYNTDPKYVNRGSEKEQKEGIRKTLEGTRFLKYVDTIYKVCKEEGASPSSIVALLKQENGPDINPLNIGAVEYDPYNAGKTYAEKQGWKNFEDGLRGGVRFKVNNYSNSGQTTEHSIKYNYISEKAYIQYMTNIEAPISQSFGVKKSLTGIDPNLDKYDYYFLIPIFYNMPKEKSKNPDDINLEEKNILKPGEMKVEVIADMGITLRSEPNTNSSKLDVLEYSRRLILENQTTDSNLKIDQNFIWYKVRTYSGQSGYIAVGEKNTGMEWVKILEKVEAKEVNKDTNSKDKKQEPIVSKPVPQEKLNHKIELFAKPKKAKIIATSSLYFRSLPSKKGVSLGLYPYNKEILVLGKANFDKKEDSNYWYQVKINNKVGYMAYGTTGQNEWIEFLEVDEKVEEAKRLEEEKRKKAEEAKRLEEEKRRKAEEAKKIEEEKRRKAEEAKKIEEKKKIEKAINEKNNNVDIAKGEFEKAVKIKIIVDGLRVRTKPNISVGEIVNTYYTDDILEIDESMGIVEENAEKLLWFKIAGKEEYVSKGSLNDEPYFTFEETFEYKKPEEKAKVEPIKQKEDTTPVEKPIEKPIENKVEPKEKIKEETKEILKIVNKEKDKLGNDRQIVEDIYIAKNGETKKFLQLVYDLDIEALKNNYSKFKIIDNIGRIVATELNVKLEDLATGYKFKTKDDSFIIIRKGDVNGDGKIDTKDALYIMNLRRAGKDTYTIEKAAANLNMYTGYKDAITSEINIKTTRDFKILINGVLK